MDNHKFCSTILNETLTKMNAKRRNCCYFHVYSDCDRRIWIVIDDNVWKITTLIGHCEKHNWTKTKLKCALAHSRILGTEFKNKFMKLIDKMRNMNGKAYITIYLFIYLFISVPPFFTAVPRNHTLTEGETADFVCQAEGTQPMSITWYKDGDQVSYDYVCIPDYCRRSLFQTLKKWTIKSIQ